MDERTLRTYDQQASSFAQEWHAQPPPSDMHALLRRFFNAGPTADIGCGSGRDTAWLNEQGFPAVGYDASNGLLAEARRLNPHLTFHQSSLPNLPGIANNSFTNVLCETVIMHLERAMIGPSVQRLMAILESGGTLYLSWRVTREADRRDEHNRLYTAFDPALVYRELPNILWEEQVDSASSGKLVQRIVARKA